jgi:hypothetical protein
MTGGAIAAAIIGWVIIFGVLGFCFSRLGKGGNWED